MANVVEIQVVGRDQASPALNKVGSTGRSVADGFRSTGRRLAAAVGIGFATAKIVQFGGDMLSTSARVRTAGRQMELVFEGGAKEVSAFARENARSFGLTESAMQGAIAGFGGLARSIGFTAEEATGMSTTTAELAAALVNARPDLGDFDTVMAALSAGITGNREEMKRWGVNVQQADIDARLAAQGLSELEGEARKQAEAQAFLSLAAEGSSLSLRDFRENGIDPSLAAGNELKATVDELKGSLATGLTPAVAAAATSLTTLLSTNAGKAAVAIGAVTAAVAIALPALRSIRDAARSMGISLATIKSGAAVAAIAALTLGLVELADKINATTTRSSADLSQLENDIVKAAVSKDDLDDLADAFGRVGDPSVGNRLNDVRQKIFSLGRDSRDLRDARKEIDEYDKTLAELVQTGPSGVEAAAAFVEQLIASGVSAGRARELLDDYQGALTELDTQEAIGAQDGLAGANKDVQTSLEQAEEAIGGYNEALQAQFDPIFGFIKAQQDFKTAQDAANEAIEEHGAGSREAREADLALSEAVVGLDSAASNLRVQIQTGNTSIGEARTRLIEMATGMGLSSGQATRLADRLIRPINKARELGGTDPNVNITETGSRLVQVKLGQVAAKVLGVPKNRLVTVSVNDLASLSIRQIRANLGTIPRSVTTTLITRRLQNQGLVPTGNAAGGVVGGIGAAQGGGPQGGPTFVGERGIELLRLPPGTGVSPNANTEMLLNRLAEGGRGGGTIVNVTVNGADPQATVEAIKRWARRNGPLPVRTRG